MASKRSHTEVEKEAEAAPAKKSLVRTPLDEALEEALFENSKEVGLPYIPYDVQGIIKQLAEPTPLEVAAEARIDELVDHIKKKLSLPCIEALRQMFDQIATTDGGKHVTPLVGRREWVALSDSIGVNIRWTAECSELFGGFGMMDASQFIKFFADHSSNPFANDVMYRKIKAQAALFVKKFQS